MKQNSQGYTSDRENMASVLRLATKEISDHQYSYSDRKIVEGHHETSNETYKDQPARFKAPIPVHMRRDSTYSNDPANLMHFVEADSSIGFAPDSSLQTSDALYTCVPDNGNVNLSAYTSGVRSCHVDGPHRYDLHSHSSKRYDCPISGCHRKGPSSFGRKDQLRDHLRNDHLQTREETRGRDDDFRAMADGRKSKKISTPGVWMRAQEILDISAPGKVRRSFQKVHFQY